MRKWEMWRCKIHVSIFSFLPCFSGPGQTKTKEEVIPAFSDLHWPGLLMREICRCSSVGRAAGGKALGNVAGSNPAVGTKRGFRVLKTGIYNKESFLGRFDCEEVFVLIGSAPVFRVIVRVMDCPGAGGRMRKNNIMSISPMRLQELNQLIAAGQERKFYDWSEWDHTRSDVLSLDNHECQICKHIKHRYRKAVLVHHVKHLKDRPDLALSIWDGKERQLVSLCRGCHEEVHPERQWCKVVKREYVTEERWD